VATQYYDWGTQFRPQSEDDPIGGKIACPGCGRIYNRQQLRFEHMCSGRLTAEPVLVTKMQWNRAERLLLGDRIAHYMQTATHKIVTSE
jgi:hypothetical protein